MSRAYILGENTLLRLWEDGGDELIAGCNTSDTISMDREFVEVTPVIGTFRAYKPTYAGGSLGFDGVVFFEGVSDTNTGANTHITWMLNATLLNFSIRWTDGTTTEGLDGQCYLQSLSITGAIDEFATGNVNLLITGEIVPYEAPT